MPLSRDISSLWEVCPAQCMVWHSTKRVMESNRKVQHYWNTVGESLPLGSEEAEHANGLSWDSYWRRIEIREALKKNARKIKSIGLKF